jgi:hypothetical protein
MAPTSYNFYLLITFKILLLFKIFSSLKNCTLEINEENLNRSDDIMLNLNDAFNKNSDFDFVNKNMTEDKTASFLQANNESVIKSSHLTNNHMSKFESQSISPIHTKTNTISEEESSVGKNFFL